MNPVLRRIQSLYEQRDWTQARFAREIGLSKVTVYGWFANDRHPSCEDLVKIADLFRVSCDWLLRGRTVTADPAVRQLVDTLETLSEDERQQAYGALTMYLQQFSRQIKGSEAGRQPDITPLG